MMYGITQQEEIKTIQPRKIELNLSTNDVNKLAEKAGAVGLTIAELLQNFIGDLIDGTYSNGSDERMYAQQWFERCWFGMFSDFTFLHYLLEQCGGVEEAVTLWEDIKEAKDDIASCEANPSETEDDEIAGLQEDIDYWQERLDDIWKVYTEIKKEYKNGTLEEEMKIVFKWENDRLAFINGDSE